MQGVLGSDWMHIWSSALSAQPVHMARPVPLSSFTWHVQRELDVLRILVLRLERKARLLYVESSQLHHAIGMENHACLRHDFIVTSARLYRNPQGDHMFQVGEAFYCYTYIHIYIYYFPWSRIRARMHVCCSSSDAELHPSETNSSIHDGSHAAAPS